MLKIVKMALSIALVPVQLYLGYLTYKNFIAHKQNPQVSTQIIKEEVHSSTETGQTENQSEPTEEQLPELPADHPKITKGQPKIIDLSPEATVNGLTIGQTTTSQAVAALGKPMNIHQDSVYIYDNINLYFKNNILDGFIFPNPSEGFSPNPGSSLLKTSSGLTFGAPLQKVFERYGLQKTLGSGKIIYRDKTNGYILNIYHRDNKVIAIEVNSN